jgi:hypothetical protein
MKGFGPWVDITHPDFGALAGVGNAAITTPAIQAAVNYSFTNAGAVTFFPPGLFEIIAFYSANVAIALPNNTILQGSGGLSTLRVASLQNSLIYMLMNKGAADGLTGAARMNQYIQIRDLELTSGTGGTLGAGKKHQAITFWPTKLFTLERLYIHDLPGDGATEHFGIYISGDDQGNTTTFNRLPGGTVSNCRIENVGTGLGLQNLGGVKVSNCEAYNCTQFQGFTASGTGAANACRDVIWSGNIADTCGNGFEIETAFLTCTSNVARFCVNAGIRLTSGAKACRVIGNEVYGNNTSNTAGARGSGIVLDDIGVVPSDCIVMGNRCYDPLGAGGTQNYGIAQDLTVRGNNNLIINNDCRGNKLGTTLNVLAFQQTKASTGALNLTAVQTVVTGCTLTVILDVDCIVTFDGVAQVDWTAGTAAGNLDDNILIWGRVDAANTGAGQSNCVVAAKGKDQVPLAWQQALAAGTHSFDITAQNTIGARGQVSAANFALTLTPNQQ